MKIRVWMIWGILGVMLAGALGLGSEAGMVWAAEEEETTGVNVQEVPSRTEAAEDEGERGTSSRNEGEEEATEEGETEEGETSTKIGSCGAEYFLGFRPWYADLCDGDTKENKIAFPSGESDEALARFIWTIVLNVLFDVTLAVGYLAVAFIIYGGFLYITSQGDPGRALKGKKTLTSAVIGTVIAMVASIAVNTVQTILSISGSAGIDQGVDVAKRVGDAFAWAYSVAGVIAVVFIIKGAIQYAMSQGDPGKVQTATRSIIYAVVGLVVVILAAAITAFVMNATGGAIE